MKFNKTTIVKALVSFGLLWLLLSQVQFNEIVKSIRIIPTIILFAVLALNLLGMFLKSLRWKVLLPEYSFVRLLYFSFVGVFYSQVLPGQFFGEIMKAYRLTKVKNKKYSEKIYISVFVDKYLGLLSIVSLIFIGFIVSNRKYDHMYVVNLILLVLCGLLLPLIIKMKTLKSFFTTIVQKIEKINILSKTANVFRQTFVALLNYVYNPKKLIFVFCISLIYQSIPIITRTTIGNALGMEITFWDWCWISGLESLVMFLPISIGGIGVREATLVGFLVAFSVSMPKILALSFIILGIIIVISCIGFVIDIVYKNKDAI